MVGPTVLRRSDAEQVAGLLDSPEIASLIAELEATRWTGRPGYPVRAMVGMALVKALYALPTWARVVALVAEHVALSVTLGATPSVDACYRFTTKLRRHGDLLDACIAAVLASLRTECPDFGKDVAIDGSDLPAYANGQRFVSKGGRERERFSDPDASWGHRSAVSTRKGGGYYGYKLHAAVCTRTDLPVAWDVRTAKDAEAPLVSELLDAMGVNGFHPETMIADKGYDVGPVYEACELRGVRPIIPLRQTPYVVAGRAKPPSCEHGAWTFAGSDEKRGAAKYRCSTGECSPASVWLRADRLHTLIPRESARWRKLYRSRGAVERGFGRLKGEWGLLPLRVRGLDRVRLHADLTILGKLAVALSRARAVPLAA